MVSYIFAVSIMILLYHSLMISIEKYEHDNFKDIPFRLKLYTICWYIYTLVMPYLTGGGIGTIATWVMIGYAIYDGNKRKNRNHQ